MTRRPRSQDPSAATEASDEIVRTTLDDDTVALLREAARERGMPVDRLIAALLHAASTRIDDLLGNAR